jgi:predicted dehydrogenase
MWKGLFNLFGSLTGEQDMDLTIARSATGVQQRTRVAFVGCALGRQRYGSLLRVMPEIEVAAVVDPDITLARAWAREIASRTPAFEKTAEMLARVEAEVVIVGSPLRQRHEDVAACLAAAIPTLVEVPSAGRLPDLDALAGMAGGTLLMPAFFRRLDPYFIALEAALKSGKYGTVQHIRCDWSFPVGGALTLESGVDPIDGAMALLLHVACQTTDICRWMLGEAISVSADIEVPERTLPGRAAGGRQPRQPIMANLIIAPEQGQATHHLTQSRAQVPQEQYTVACSQQRVELIVSAGERASSGDAPVLKAGPAGTTGEVIPVELPISGLPAAAVRTQEMLRHFLACAKGEAEPRVIWADIRTAQETVQGALLSARDNVKVSLPLRRPSDGSRPARRLTQG